jgi:hypothetical protein
VSKGKILLGFTYLHIDFTLNKAGIRVFPVKTEYVTDAPPQYTILVPNGEELAMLGLYFAF